MSSAAAMVSRFEPKRQAEAALRLRRELDEAYARDAYLWATQQVWTVDEADKQIKRWPDLPYLKELFAAMDEEQQLAIPKSRRMKVTWSVAAKLVHWTRYFENMANFFQSETESKAAYTVEKRCAFIEDHLDDPMLRRPYAGLRTTEGLIGRMTYGNGSEILAIAEGSDKIRMFTPSVLVMDESDFQRRGHQALVAALATVEKKAKIIVLSSSNGPLGVLAGICREAGFVRWSG